MDNRRVNKNNVGKKISLPSKIMPIAVVSIILIVALLFFVHPQIFYSISFGAARLKNAFSYYIMNENPRFYYLEMEKNGKDIRVGNGDYLEITYRDEFVVKSVISDDFSGRYIIVKFDGMSDAANDFGVLLKGIDFVNKIIKKGNSIAETSGVVSDYKISVNYGKDNIASVGLKIIITPQDWFRFAKDSSNANEQIEYLKKAISLNKDDISVRKILAGVYAKQGRLDEAVVQYKGVLGIKPDDTTAMLELAKCYIKKKEYDQAIKISKEVIALNPKDGEAYVALGLSFSEKGFWAQAAQNYNEAVRIEPDNHQIRFKLAEAYKNSNKVNAAIEEYKFIASHAKEANEALFALGDLYLKLKKYDDAVKCYKEIISRQPGNAVAYANLAAAYAGIGNWENERDSLKKAVLLKPAEPAIRFNLGAAYERKKMDAEAVKEYENVLKINPDDPEAMERLADLALKNRQFGQAVKYYEKLKIKYPKKTSIYSSLGFSYGELKKYPLSAEHYELAIRSGARDSVLHYNLACTYDKMGMERKAVAEYEKTSPLTKEVLGIIANFYLKEKNFVKAINYYKKVIDLEPKKAGSYASLAYAYAEAAEWDLAIRNYKIALRYDHEDDDIYAGLGEAYERKGLYQEALKAYNNAYELNPESEKAAQKIPRLKIKILQEKAQIKSRSEEE